MFAKISVDPDGMEVVLNLVTTDGIDLNSSSIKAELDAAGVCYGIDMALIETIVNDVQSSSSKDDSNKGEGEEAGEAQQGEEAGAKKQTSFVIAHAKKPKSGKNGEVVYKVDTDRHHHADAKSAKVDYRESRKIESVKQGQVIAEIELPTEGTPGTSVLGKPLPARDGRPAQIKAGKNVELRDESIVAESEGIVIKVGNVISVSPVYEVAGGVDMEVGNIDFNGTVIIAGDVGDDFIVKAGGDIQVSGAVGKATLISQGNVSINGGFNGKDKGLIVAEGTVSAKYINHGNIRAQGLVEVKKEINNSVVYTLDEVDISRGSILGGSVMALLGVKAAHLGSEMGVKTTLILGSHYKLFALEEKLKKLNETFAEIERKINPYVDNSPKFDALPDNRKEELKKLREKCIESRKEFLEAQEKIGPLIEEARNRKAEAIIGKTIYPDVVLRTKNCFRTFNEELLGPLKAVEDIENSTIQVGKVE